MIAQHVGRRSSITARQLLGVCQFRRADGVRDGASHGLAAAAAADSHHSVLAGRVAGTLAAGGTTLVGAVGHWLAVADLQRRQEQYEVNPKVFKSCPWVLELDEVVQLDLFDSVIICHY